MRSTSARTVFLNGRFLTQRITGVQRYAFESLLALDRLWSTPPIPGVRLVLAMPRNAPRIELHAIETERFGRFAGHAWEQIDLPRRVGDQLLIGFSATGPAAKKNQLLTVHDAAVYAVPYSFSWKFRVFYKSLLRILAARSRLLMTVSQFSKEEITAALRIDERKVVVSTEGTEHVFRVRPDRSILDRHQLEPQRFVLAVSSQAAHKNFHAVVRAAALLKDYPVEIVIAGGTNSRVFGGTDRANGARVRHVGYATDAELRALYEAAMVFVFPSRYEGFGIPPLEAMALGCPVIASNAASIPEVCGPAALYFAPDDHAQLANLIRTLAADAGLRAKMVRDGRAHASRFSWTNTANAIVSAIDRCLADERRRQPS